MLSTSLSWFKERLRLFQHRYNRLLTVFALIITYATAIIIVFGLWSGHTIMLYGSILLGLACVALFLLLGMFICSLFGKGREWFDERFDYSPTELIPYIIRLDKLEERMTKVESIVKRILKEVRYENKTNTKGKRGKSKDQES